MTVTIKGMATIAKPKQTNCNKTKEYNGKHAHVNEIRN